jgi:SAM-dependent methyltransferase
MASNETVPEQGSRGFRFLPEAWGEKPEQWFREHYEEAPQQVIDFFGGDGIAFEGKAVGDIGCGDGIIDLGLAHRGRPRTLVGFDLLSVDREGLAQEARRHGALEGDLPDALEFRTNGPVELPAANAEFDLLVSWSTFEHVVRPVALLQEMRRVIRPDGILFLQIWPLYYSEHGSHLWPWFPEGYGHLLHSDEDIEAIVRSDDKGGGADAEFLLEEYRSLNRMTVDELQRSLTAAGFFITKFELQTTTMRITPELARYPLSLLGIGGIKLMAVPLG